MTIVPKILLFLILILVLTKSDLLNDDQLSDARSKGIELTHTYKMNSHYITSSYSGFGVKEVFQAAAACVDITYSHKDPVINTLDGDTQPREGCC